MQQTQQQVPEISLVVPFYNEAAVLTEFHRRASSALRSLGLAYEIVYVDDGSSDESCDLVCGFSHEDPAVTLVRLSRNFGKEIALTAGLDFARGQAVVCIDADLQDPPELIGALVEQWRAGYDVVYGRRIRRHGESALKRTTAYLFYRFMYRLNRVRLPPDSGDFRLLSRVAVDAVRTLREQHRFMKGIFAWIGFRQKAVDYERDPRAAGTTKLNYWRLWNLAVEGITSFTIAPLKIATYFGLCIALAAFIYGLVIIYKTLVFGDPVRGYPSMMVVVLFLGAVQLTCLGLIGEYVGRTFNESKGRPLYFVRQVSGAGSGRAGPNLPQPAAAELASPRGFEPLLPP